MEEGEIADAANTLIKSLLLAKMKVRGPDMLQILLL